MKQADYLQKLRRRYHKVDCVQKPTLILYFRTEVLTYRTDRFSMLADFLLASFVQLVFSRCYLESILYQELFRFLS